MHTIYSCFPGGKHKALTMSYDDGKIFDRRLVSIFNRYGIKGTFHLNSSFLGNETHVAPEEVKTLYAGHEVACHTATHPTIARCPLEQVARQILEDRESLENLVGYPVRGLSYPNGSYSSQIQALLPSLGIRYARVTGGTDGFGLPEDYYEWKPTCHHTHFLLENGKTFTELCKKQYLYLMYVWGHSYEFNDADNWGLMEDFCRLAGGRADTWYATNIEIADYMSLCSALRFSAKGDFVLNPGAASAFLSVDGRVVEIPGGTQAEL